MLINLCVSAPIILYTWARIGGDLAIQPRKHPQDPGIHRELAEFRRTLAAVKAEMFPGMTDVELIFTRDKEASIAKVGAAEGVEVNRLFIQKSLMVSGNSARPGGLGGVMMYIFGRIDGRGPRTADLPRLEGAVNVRGIGVAVNPLARQNPPDRVENAKFFEPRADKKCDNKSPGILEIGSFHREAWKRSNVENLAEPWS